ncbi:hypothetical protein EJ04DRAFT_87500 [Polyplosphaeria fusca]|uniref:Spherulation-specific family 4 n=1 Tax=Polyplosphaeria fusca TaxID=682080 RepID=A0A9P4R1T7_9PLEO|nr:hypothetical protein EJ04DRAFT_87500 [Polyplosphaeria fusca]
MSILLPLYIYPWPGTWDPLYWIANTNPKLNITVILNPCSGPCVNGIPEQPYIDEMPKLKDWPNIRTLGYVATNYTNKPLDTVLAEIATYSNWPQILNNSRMAVDGIFFDETPGAYDWRKHDYLKAATDAVKGNAGLGQRVVVQNPGTIPDLVWNYLDISDITVIYEETYLHFLDASIFNRLKTFSAQTNLTKSHFALMIHSVPNIPQELVEWTAAQMKQMTGWNFLSSVSVAGEYWHSFSNVFSPFMQAYARAAG